MRRLTLVLAAVVLCGTAAPLAARHKQVPPQRPPSAQPAPAPPEHLPDDESRDSRSAEGESTPPGTVENSKKTPRTPVSDRDGEPRWHSQIEVALSVAVLVFGAILVGLEVLLLFRRPHWSPGWVLKLIGLTLVVTSGLFLIVAGFSQTQTASMMGLLGTIAGYILGKDAPQQMDGAGLSSQGRPSE